MTPTERAREIVSNYLKVMGWAGMEDDHQLVEAIAAALTPPAGHVVTDDGVTRRYLGTLPLTADGCVMGMGALPWSPPELDDEPQQADDIQITSCQNGRGELGVATVFFSIGDGIWYPADKCYSTREAAEAARSAT